jgi:purine-binding chemotaxis protein CheW
VRKTVAAIPSVQLVVFRLGNAEFAVEVFAVQEILRRQPVVAVPKAPAFVEGVLELRGALVPVVDLRRRFGVEQPEYDNGTRVMIARVGDERIGLVVDAVTEVVRVPETALTDPPPYVRDVAAEYVRSIAQLGDRLLVVVDFQRVLSAEEIGQLADLERALERAHAERTRDSESRHADPSEESVPHTGASSKEAQP